MKIRNEFTCPLEFVHDIIKGKWKPIIIFKLRKEGKSLSSLEREIHGISQKMLLQHLKELQAYDIVSKISNDGYPLSVTYSLTQKRGRELLSAIEIMQAVGIQIMLDRNQEALLNEKGIDVKKCLAYTHKKVGNVQSEDE